MDDAFCVGRIQRIGDLRGQFKQRTVGKGFPPIRFLRVWPTSNSMEKKYPRSSISLMWQMLG
jgi:hypothetical protein